MTARQADHKRDSAHQYEAEGPSRIQIEPTPAHELETQVSVDQPGQDAAGCDHRDRVDDGNQGGHAEVGIDEVGCRLMAAVEVSGAAETKIDRYQHQSRAMSDRHGEGPQAQLGRWYPRQPPRMTPVDEPEEAETDDQQAGADLDLPLPFDERDEQGKRKQDHQHGQQVAKRQRPERRD